MLVTGALYSRTGHVMGENAKPVPNTGKKVVIACIISVVLVALAGFGIYSLVNAKAIEINPLFANGKVQGVDVSSREANVDFHQLKEQGIQFAYIAATEGSSHVDEFFSVNWSNANASEMPVGAYHFFSFDTPGRDQAQNFIHVVGSNMASHLIPAVVLMTESNQPSVDEVVFELNEYMNILEAEYGQRPILYISKADYDAYIAGHEEFSNVRIWADSTSAPAKLAWGDNWTIWHYTENGKLDGHMGPDGLVDRDVLASKVSVKDITL